jgi:hypothetical protein
MRLTEDEYQAIKRKVEREFPIRVRLAALAGRPPLNAKNERALMAFDDTIVELLAEIRTNKPENLSEAEKVAQ